MRAEDSEKRKCGAKIPPRPVVKCDKLSMNVVAAYPSAMEAEKENGLKRSRVAQMCGKKSVSSGVHVYRYADEYDQNESFEGKFNRPVAMYDSANESLSLFENLQKASKAVGVCPSTISASMTNRNMVCERYVFKYAR